MQFLTDGKAVPLNGVEKEVIFHRTSRRVMKCVSQHRVRENVRKIMVVYDNRLKAKT